MSSTVSSEASPMSPEKVSGEALRMPVPYEWGGSQLSNTDLSSPLSCACVEQAILAMGQSANRYWIVWGSCSRGGGTPCRLIQLPAFPAEWPLASPAKIPSCHLPLSWSLSMRTVPGMEPAWGFSSRVCSYSVGELQLTWDLQSHVCSNLGIY